MLAERTTPGNAACPIAPRCESSTRAELAGKRTKGTTPKYEPIAPAIVTALITGLRVSHMLALDWSDIDFEALDDNGKAVVKSRRREGARRSARGLSASRSHRACADCSPR
jgi:integrase